MRHTFAAIATAATLACFLAPGASAMTVGTAPGIQQGLAETSAIEQARTVCRDDPVTRQRVCWIDRSQPPTVCHWVRDRNGNLVRDCY